MTFTPDHCGDCGLTMGTEHDEAEQAWSRHLVLLAGVSAFLADDPERDDERAAVEQAIIDTRTHAMPECHPESLS